MFTLHRYIIRCMSWLTDCLVERERERDYLNDRRPGRPRNGIKKGKGETCYFVLPTRRCHQYLTEAFPVRERFCRSTEKRSLVGRHDQVRADSLLPFLFRRSSFKQTGRENKRAITLYALSSSRRGFFSDSPLLYKRLKTPSLCCCYWQNSAHAL